MAEISVKVNSKIDYVNKELDLRGWLALNAIGLTAERYASELCPVDTSNLRDSLTYVVNEAQKNVAIGTNVEYGKYVEFCNYKHTNGQSHFLRDALQNHLGEYEALVKNFLET